MTVEAAALTQPLSPAAPYLPPGEFQGSFEEFDYVEEEYFASGTADGRPYSTTLVIRRPRDTARFSGTVVAEPLHALGASPVWMYTSREQMRSGHVSAVITSQKTALDTHVKPFAPPRYESLAIEGDPPPPGAPEIDVFNMPIGDPDKMAAFRAEMQRRNSASNAILGQVGAALGASAGPLEGWGVGRVLLVGHSQTGAVVTDYIKNAHAVDRRADGRAVFDGYFPTGAPSEPFSPCEVPIVQVLSDGDISDPHRPGPLGPVGVERRYRRNDSDVPNDLFRLYELAGVAHMGTRYAPYSDPQWWQMVQTAGDVGREVRMNSLPHNELFGMALHHLVGWTAEGTPPPRAERLVIGADGYFAADEHGNSRGGVRNAMIDVPLARYFANPRDESGAPAFGVVGTEEQLPHETLRQLYKDHDDYVERFNRRLDALVADGWFLAADAEELRTEAAKAQVP
jgi:hypothetical protein